MIARGAFASASAISFTTTTTTTTATTTTFTFASGVRRWLGGILAVFVAGAAFEVRAAPGETREVEVGEVEVGEDEVGEDVAAEPSTEPDAEPAAESGGEGAPDGEAAPDERAEPEGEGNGASEAVGEPSPQAETSSAPATKVSKSPPSPRGIRTVATRIAVGVGLSPEAPGTKTERALVETLKRSLSASTDPASDVRHVSAGSGDPRTICRERRDDLVVMIGYLPERDDPVVLTHDCRLDRSLGVRSSKAASEPALLGALWEEHEELVRQGVRERRTIRRLSPTARGVIIGVVAVAVVGTAIGLLVANALRDERVVVTVSP